MNVLVTGASGFIGRHVVLELLKNPEIKVTATTTNIESAEKLSFFPKVQFIEIDLSKTDLSKKLDIKSFDLLIHLAWGGLPNYNNVIHLQKNLVWNMSFLRKMIEAGIGNICVTGTCLEYGKQEGKLKEDMQCKPDTPYAVAKYTLWYYLEKLNSDNHFSFKWMRLFYTFGEGQSEQSLMHQLNSAISAGDTEFPMSGGEQVRDFLDVKILARNIVHCALQKKVTGIINCCSGKPVKVREFVEQWLDKKQSQMKLKLGVYPYPDYEAMAFWGDTQKLEKALISKPDLLMKSPG